MMCEQPKKKQIDIVATKVANAYPESFMDGDGEELFGTGSEALSKCLMNRVENVNRTPSVARKRLLECGTPRKAPKSADM